MSIAITFILNILKKKLLEFMKSKYFWICVIISVILVIIFSFNLRLKSKDKKIKELENKLYTTKLELSNMVILKNIAFISNKNYINEIYTNSSKAIENITDDRFYNSNEIFILNEIIKDYNTKD